VQLAKFARQCEQYQIPCTLFHLSSGYTMGADGKRYVFNWNRKRVPEPEQMVEDFHTHGIRLAANIKPCLLVSHPRFDEVKKLGGLHPFNQTLTSRRSSPFGRRCGSTRLFKSGGCELVETKRQGTAA